MPSNFFGSNNYNFVFVLSSYNKSSTLKNPMAIAIFLAFLLFFPIVSQSQTTNFTFNGFSGNETNFDLDQKASIITGGALMLTDTSPQVIGHAFYAKQIQMFDKTSSLAPNFSSFSTHFVFAIVPPSSGRGGYGLAFTVAPSIEFPGAGSDHYLGIFNSSNDGDPNNHIFAVEFDTVKGFKENSDTAGSDVGININSMNSTKFEPARYFVDMDNSESLILESGDPIQAWIEYDGVAKVVNVTIAPLNKEKPIKPLISYGINLADNLSDTMYVGFSASTGNKSSSHYILGWSFSMNLNATPLDLSQLPSTPKKRDTSSSSFKPQVITLIAVFCAVTVLFLGILVYFAWCKWKNQPEDIEEWELDCPHRFRFKDLYAATKGFKESEMIGVGGFGAVYKGVLPTSTTEVAVKKITRNSIQGMREFAAEIESLGRLRHKHLVNLQGWCKKKNDLLLIYDYIPNGSLDSLLFNPKNGFVLSWEQRFNIVKGIAAGLLYLHEEWEQVVIHRDIKSSNVLIDADMNARLGDFGLARLCDHGTLSHTTNIVGTIGYIAPELARSGKASASSDVFAYGVLLLEVASGRRPVDSDHFVLLDWVMEFQQLGRVMDVVDPNLNSSYVVEEMELILALGLFCSHPKPEVRPTMRQVTLYLNGDEPLPVVDDWSSFDSRQLSEMNSRFLQVISGDMTTTSYQSSSIGSFSSSSMANGR